MTVTDNGVTTADKISKAVSEAGGIKRVSLADLRDELGFSRLGKKVLASMEAHLTESGLGFFPGDMLDPIVNSEPRQWQEVWVYERDGSVKSNILDAFADPDTYDLADALSVLDNTGNGAAPNYAKMSNPAKIALIRNIVAE